MGESEKLHFEDFKPGAVFDLGSRTVSQEEIVRFATAFDPQPFHIDEAAALSYPYGGLIASGWHTGSILMRLMVDGLIGRATSLASPGVDELRWLKPVRPGDTLRAIMTVGECVPSRSKPDRGLVHFVAEMRNQKDERVLSMRGKAFYGRRHPGAPA